MQFKTCIICDATFSKSTSESKAHWERHKCCSRECSIKYMAIKSQTPEANEKRRLKGLGKKHSNESRKKMSGSNSPGWRGGVTSENKRIRSTTQYKEWRTAVFERDDYTCQQCCVRGCYLEADHIKQFAYYPELRFEVSNGRTLCKECHKKTETYKNKRICQRQD